MPRRFRPANWLSEKTNMLNNHKQIIKGRDVVDDDWSVLRLDEGQTAEAVEVPAG